MFWIYLIWLIVGVIFGGYILFAGRHAIWATLGIIGFSVTVNLLTTLVAGLDIGRDLLENQEWGMIGIAIIVGVLGIALGRIKPDLSVLIIGFAAGADTALWFYEISTHLMTNVARQSEQTAFWVGLGILLVGGLLGLWLVKTIRDEALIFITMLVGVQLIQSALNLSTTSSWTAIIMLTLALAGVLVQYAIYLREVKAGQEEPKPHASSIAFFQDLELRR